jgi:hypothetical protein
MGRQSKIYSWGSRLSNMKYLCTSSCITGLTSTGATAGATAAEEKQKAWKSPSLVNLVTKAMKILAVSE